MAQPTVKDVQALDGRIFATLTPEELEILNFYREQGRKYGVSVQITGEDVDPEKLKRAKSQEHADHILRRTNSRVVVESRSEQSATQQRVELIGLALVVGFLILFLTGLFGYFGWAEWIGTKETGLTLLKDSRIFGGAAILLATFRWFGARKRRQNKRL